VEKSIEEVASSKDAYSHEDLKVGTFPYADQKAFSHIEAFIDMGEKCLGSLIVKFSSLKSFIRAITEAISKSRIVRYYMDS